MMNGEEHKPDLRQRTKQYALRIIRLCATLGTTGAAGVIARQLLRSGTSVGAQYREACRARSTAEFISKMESATQELDESGYWIELLLEGHLVEERLLGDLQRETDELIAIFVSSAKTAKNN